MDYGRLSKTIEQWVVRGKMAMQEGENYADDAESEGSAVAPRDPWISDPE